MIVWVVGWGGLTCLYLRCRGCTWHGQRKRGVWECVQVGVGVWSVLAFGLVGKTILLQTFSCMMYDVLLQGVAMQIPVLRRCGRVIFI
jgi:hypothetical protein